MMDGEPPCGFFRTIQGKPWRKDKYRELAIEVMNSLSLDDRTSEAVSLSYAKALKSVPSYAASDEVISLLSACKSISDDAARSINLAYFFNDQVSGSGARDVLTEILQKNGHNLQPV